MIGAIEIEIYIKGSEINEIVSFLNKEIGTLCFDSKIDDGHNLYTCDDIKILINTGIQDGYISVYLKGARKWTSEVEFARIVALSLGVTVRCDPGNEYPDVPTYSDTFLEINKQGEGLIEWC